MVNAFIAFIYSGLYYGEDCKGKVSGVCWRAYLVEYYIELFAFCCKAHHCLEEVVSELAVEPCRAEDECLAAALLYCKLAV